ncbi:MAG: hypothetical protein EXS30_09795 [Pedosphaera sp.]|nr:hypothetical protein [Pedosphaera sp.]
MTQTNLKAELEPIARSYRRFQLWRSLAFCWAWAAIAAGLFLLLYGVTGWFAAFTVPLVIASTVLAAGVIWMRNRATEPAYRWIAQQIERENPKLNTLLLAAVQQQPDAATGELDYLQERVVREALTENRKQPWVQKHTERLFFAQCSQWIAFALLAGALLVLGLIVSPAARARVAEAKGVSVSPGNTSIERGSGLVVLARFGDKLPAEAALVINSKEEGSRRISLAKNLNDPVFGGTLSEVKHDLAYHIEYGERGELRTPDFKVEVFDFPALLRSDAQLTFPKYTELPPKRIEETRRVSAVEGTVVDYSFQLNKPVSSAKLIAKDKSVIPLIPDNTRSNSYLVKMSLDESKHFELQLIDESGRTNKTPTDIVIDVLANRTPELKLTFPRQDLRASPLEELSLQAQASDDFGLRAYGVAYTLAGTETKFIELGQKSGPNEKRQLNHLLALEAISAQPDQLLTYFVWADDLGPDGQIRRTSSDMYFAEVRHFEEIFREGQQQPESESSSPPPPGQQSSQSEKLAELQKQIINATWNLQRRETKSKPSAKYKKDVVVIQESQEKALEQAQELQSGMENPRLKPSVEIVVKEMDRALKQLKVAADNNSPRELASAVGAEQAAYQALLKLQAREFEVTRNRNRKGGGGGGGGQRAQQQLDQLELKQSENRYETQRQAASQQNQNPEQREQLQVLNRLKELAQRQQNLNERLKELQTALQEAKNEAEREAARRQLKRLRDDEREILADVDELQQRMSTPENQAQMAEARQQLDQTRSDVRQAADSLEKDAASQALASGTRAQRDLQQMREDFRKKSSGQFTEEMKQMRSEARQLAQQQEDLAKKIDTLAQSERKTLSDSAERNALADKLVQQTSGLTNVVNNMRRVTEQAESVEPLLSKQLYDTIRKTDQSRINNSLTNSAELLRRGFIPQASEPEQQARTRLDELKRGVERAAESVLGDEAEALRLARSELDELSQQLEREISKAQPGGQQPQNGNEPAQDKQNPNGQRGTGSPQENPQGAQRSASAETSPGSAEPGQKSGEGQTPSSGRGSRQGGAGRNAQAQNSDQDPNSPPARGGQRGNRSNQSAQNSPGESGNQGQPSQSQNGEQATSQEQGQGAGRQNGASPSGGRGGGGRRGGDPNAPRRFFDGNQNANAGGSTGPITGNEYLNWSDRLRDVEEMIDLPELRNQVAEIRERAKAIRAEFKRHSKEPQWSMVQSQIMIPLAEVRSRITEELGRRKSNDSLVPIDRDPVPKKFSELVKRYYEKLGTSE